MPVFLPTTLQGAEEIIESIKELKNVTSDLQPVTDQLKEEQKEGTMVPLGFPLLVKRILILGFLHVVIHLPKTSEFLSLPTR